MNRTIPSIALLLLFGASIDAQWLNQPTPGIPRTADGKPNLSAPAPTTADGKPDLTGLWRLGLEMGYAANIMADLAPGDIQLLNNHIVYHGRTAFKDDASAGQDRMLMRLWLSVPNSRALPEDHAVLWGDVDAGKPHGGIAQPATAVAA